MPRRIAIIVALQMEIAPLLRRWRQQGKPVAACDITGMMPSARAFRCDDTIALCAGIGKRAAAAATKAAIDFQEPSVIVSSGLAGALKGELRVGDIVRPVAVIDAANGARHRTAQDSTARGVLVTAGAVLSRKEKEEMARKFGADAVDMEAAVVAEIARAAGVPFLALKAISDTLDFEMPPLGQFIGSNGRVNLLKLINFAILRPSLWPVFAALRRNGNEAVERLAEELEKIVAG